MRPGRFIYLCVDVVLFNCALVVLPPAAIIHALHCKLIGHFAATKNRISTNFGVANFPRPITAKGGSVLAARLPIICPLTATMGCKTVPELHAERYGESLGVAV